MILEKTFASLVRKNTKFFKASVKRNLSFSAEARRQSELFDLEKNRQKESVGRVEKIEVQFMGPPNDAILVMNKNLSTPYDCAKHLGETLVKRSAVALINGETLWHMHRPLVESCRLELLHYKISQPSLVNKTFWRTCSFLLGAVAVNSFNDDVVTYLHSFPSPNVRSGSFVYDVQLSLKDWKPQKSELKVLSAEFVKFCQENHPIECLEVEEDFAQLVFKNNPFKSKQIPNIALNNNGKVTLFKAGYHVDISRGPMVANTNHLGKTTVANVIKIETDIPGDPIYRFQGVALPHTIILNHFAYGLIEDRAQKLNSARIPTVDQDISQEYGSFVKPQVVV